MNNQVISQQHASHKKYNNKDQQSNRRIVISALEAESLEKMIEYNKKRGETEKIVQGFLEYNGLCNEIPASTFRNRDVI